MKYKQILYHILGFFLIAFGVVGIIFAKLGASPIDAFNYFIYILTPSYITLGTITILTGLSVSLVVYIIERKRSILMSIMFLFLIGVFIDLWKIIYEILPLTFYESYFIRVPLAIISLAIVGLGAGFTLVSGYPPSPFECLMMIIHKKINNMQKSKFIIEMFFFINAIILGLMSGLLFEQVNFFTLILVVSIGPIIQYNTYYLQKILRKEVV
jgi:uncharacterized protein